MKFNWRQKWFEAVTVAIQVIVLGILCWGAAQIYYFNREVGVIAKNQESITASIVDVRNEISLIKVNSDNLERDLASELRNVRTDIAALKSDVANFRVEFGEIKTRVHDMEKTLQDLRVKLASEAKNALWDEVSKLKSFTQFGTFSDATKVGNDPLTFEWVLVQRVNPDRVLFISAVPAEPFKGIQLSAQVTGGGDKCKMTVIGSTDEFTRRLSDGIPGTVSVISEPQQSD